MATIAETRPANLGGTSSNVHLNALDWISMVLMIVGGINWGLIGLLDFNLVAAIFGDQTTATRAVYTLVGLASIYGIVLASRLAKNR